MFSLIGSLIGVTASALAIPMAVVADVVTMGGVLTDQDEPYTTKAADELVVGLVRALTPRQ
jgi:hypothetical protein